MFIIFFYYVLFYYVSLCFDKANFDKTINSLFRIIFCYFHSSCNITQISHNSKFSHQKYLFFCVTSKKNFFMGIKM